MKFKYLALCFYFSFLIANNNCLVDNKKAPLWICKASSYDLNYITAIGIATKNNLPLKIIKKLAIADARANLAETIKVNVQSELYMKTTSISQEDNELIQNEMINTIHTVAKEKIEDFTILELWQNENYLYVLIGIPLK
jgi:hypothetical protein